MIPELTYVAEMAEELDTMSSVKIGGFRSKLEASRVCNPREEPLYNETVCLWGTIYLSIYLYIYIYYHSHAFI